jgi:ABC-type branched-subunit amino acid transport system ATPase component/branched-subunit amino acid ABC-type transport system permease component
MPLPILLNCCAIQENTMNVLRFALIGLGTGAIYSMLAQGLVLVYRGSGVINFAQGAMAMVGAYAYYDLSARHGLPTWLGCILALLLCAALGVLIHMLVLKPMQRSSALARVTATLGITVSLQSGAYLLYGYNPLQLPSLLPVRTVHIVSQRLPIGLNYVIIFGIGIVLTVVLSCLYRYTSFGRTTAAVAENHIVAASLTHSPDLVASLNWAIGSVLAGFAGVLIAPILFLEPTTLVLLVVPALAAALLMQFRSFSMALVMALLLGIASSEIGFYVSEPGWATAAPFVVVICVLTVRGRHLPLRSYVLDRMPAVGTGMIRPAPVLVLYVIGAVICFNINSDWATYLSTTLTVAIVCLSIVLITGYAGQLSLAQSVLAGTGALAAARLSPHVPFLVAIVFGAVIAGVGGLLVGIPALRTRGVTLAIATLALGAALSDVLVDSTQYDGGTSGFTIRTPSLFGWSLNPLFHGNRYAFVTLTIVALLALAMSNLRRGVTGRRMLAMRSNERASAALGVPSSYLKLYAFVLSAAVAGVGGVLLAFLQPVVQVGDISTFTVFSGILLVSVTVIGGVGFVGGAIIGSTLVAGGIASKIFGGWSQVNEYLPLIGGLNVLVILIFQPDGIFEGNRELLVRVRARLERRVRVAGPWRKASVHRPTYHVTASTPVVPQTLAVSDLSVAFGGVRALQGVSLEVRPGQIHGVIGPNGAGKTTLIDAMTGFVTAAHGSVRIGPQDVTNWSARRRATAGISRSFQSLELFEDLTILENIAVACERPGTARYILDLFRPGKIRLSGSAMEALRDFELVDIVDKKPQEVSFGQRKIVAIARAMSTSPAVLLLDEPAAGLDDYEAAELANVIVRIARDWGLGVLLVEHKVDMVMSISDRITVMESGKMLASGVADEIAQNAAVVDAYLGAGLAV